MLGSAPSAPQVLVDGLTGHAQELSDLRHRHVPPLQPPGHVAPDLRQEGFTELAMISGENSICLSYL